MAKKFEDYPRPALAVDPAVLTVENDKVFTLLWRRRDEPAKGKWGLPGVFVNPPPEDLEGAVRRGLRDKAHITQLRYLEQLFTWDKELRDERGWVVTVAYYALVEPRHLHRALTDHEDVCQAEVVAPPPNGRLKRVRLQDSQGRRISAAFDHDEILAVVMERMRGRLSDYTDVALKVLPSKFTLRQLQSVYEAVLGEPVNKDSFRRTVTVTHQLVEPTGEYQAVAGRRVAELYRGR